MNYGRITTTLITMIASLPVASAEKQEADPKSRYYDIVGFATSRAGELHMVTLGRDWKWLRETVKLPRPEPEQVVLSDSGTKVLVSYQNGEKLYLGDLSAEPPVWDVCLHTHVLPDTVYPLVHENGVDLVTERDLWSVAKCKPPKADETSVPWPQKVSPRVLTLEKRTSIVAKNMAAFALTDEWLVYAMTDGKLVVKNRVSNVSRTIDHEEIGRIERVYPREDGGVSIVTFHNGAYSGYRLEPADRSRARTEFEPVSDVVTSRFYGALAQTPYDEPIPPLLDNGGRFEFTRLRATHELYAPVLQFDAAEMVLPTTVDFWTKNDIPVEKEPDYLGWYRNSERECKIYYRVKNFPGTRLYEYWAYYPLDVGQFNSHRHDTEHTFIEVQTLRGVPRAVLSAGHGPMALNNIYSSFGATESGTLIYPELPIFTIVERGKHAMAPDINADGRFTFGADVNIVSERSQIWGIRDYFGQTDDHISRWDASMSLPRRRENVYTTEVFHKYFEHRESDLTLELDRDRTCSLVAFPPPPPRDPKKEKDQLRLRIQYEAMQKLNEHGDAKDPASIYKKHVFPDWSIKGGVGWDWFNNGVVSAAYTTNIDRIRIPLFWRDEPLRIPLPGRLSGEFMIAYKENRPGSVPIRGTNRRIEKDGYPLQIGFRYEKNMVNYFGFYAGFHKRYLKRVDEELLGERVGLGLGPSSWRSLFRAGFLFELSRYTLYAGPIWTDEPTTGFGFELLFAFKIRSGKGRTHFGLKQTDAHPK